MASGSDSRDGPEQREAISQDIDRDVQMPLQEELEQIQKRTFTNWVNAQLSKRKPPCTLVQNLFIDFRDGSRLLDLLEVMSGERIGCERGNSTFHQRSNIQTALSFLEKKSIKLVNINTPDIINGNPSIILGLIWIIIRQYHIVELASSLSLRPSQSPVESLASLDSHSTSTLSSHSASSSSLPSRSSSHIEIYAKKVLLLWVIEQCLKAGCTLDVKDFKASWRSGEVFLAIIYALRPDLVDLSKATTRSNKQNLEEAFRTAERELQIPRLLEPDDVDVRDPDERSIMMYVAQFLQYSRDLPVPEDDIQIKEGQGTQQTNIHKVEHNARRNTMAGSDVRIVLLGKTGVGKSATGNTILGTEEFVVERSPASVTRQCKKFETKVSGRKVVVVDTPGLFDTSFSNEEMKEAILECVKMTVPGPHVFLLLIRLGVRFTQEEQTTMKWIQENFSKLALKYALVLFTGGDDVEDLEDYIEKSPELGQLISECGGRYHTFDNTKNDRAQVTRLLAKIDRMVKANGGQHYTDKMYLEAQRKIKEEEERIRREEEMKRQEEERKRQEEQRKKEEAMRKEWEIQEKQRREEDRKRFEEEKRQRLEEERKKFEEEKRQRLEEERKKREEDKKEWERKEKERLEEERKRREEDKKEWERKEKQRLEEERKRFEEDKRQRHEEERQSRKEEKEEWEINEKQRLEEERKKREEDKKEWERKEKERLEEERKRREEDKKEWEIKEKQRLEEERKRFEEEKRQMLEEERKKFEEEKRQRLEEERKKREEDKKEWERKEKERLDEERKRREEDKKEWEIKEKQRLEEERKRFEEERKKREEDKKEYERRIEKDGKRFEEQERKRREEERQSRKEEKEEWEIKEKQRLEEERKKREEDKKEWERKEKERLEEERKRREEDKKEWEIKEKQRLEEERKRFEEERKMREEDKKEYERRIEKDGKRFEEQERKRREEERQSRKEEREEWERRRKEEKEEEERKKQEKAGWVKPFAIVGKTILTPPAAVAGALFGLTKGHPIDGVTETVEELWDA